MLTETQLHQGANATPTSIMENLGYKEGSTKPRRSMRSISTVAIKSEAEQPLAEASANNTRYVQEEVNVRIANARVTELSVNFQNLGSAEIKYFANIPKCIQV